MVLETSIALLTVFLEASLTRYLMVDFDEVELSFIRPCQITSESMYFLLDKSTSSSQPALASLLSGLISGAEIGVTISTNLDIGIDGDINGGDLDGGDLDDNGGGLS